VQSKPSALPTRHCRVGSSHLWSQDLRRKTAYWISHKLGKACLLRYGLQQCVHTGVPHASHRVLASAGATEMRKLTRDASQKMRSSSQKLRTE
jgi:hypothetical protein